MSRHRCTARRQGAAPAYAPCCLASSTTLAPPLRSHTPPPPSQSDIINPVSRLMGSDCDWEHAMVYEDGNADCEHAMVYEDGDWMLLRMFIAGLVQEDEGDMLVPG